MNLRARIVRTARSALAALFFAGFAVGSLVVGFLFFPPLRLFGFARAMRSMVRLAWRFFVAAADALGLFRVEISPADRARLAAAKGVVVASTHVSLIDVVILISLLPDATAIAKSAAGSNFFYSSIVKGAFIANDDACSVLEASVASLAQGVSVVVFPEGTRRDGDGARLPMRRGAAWIALHASAPVLPVTLDCDPPVLARGQSWYDVGDRKIVWKVALHDAIVSSADPTRASVDELTGRLAGILNLDDRHNPERT